MGSETLGLDWAAVAAVVGGTSSRISGGKFANGAATAAFSSLLSSGARAAADKSSWQESVDKVKNLADSLAEREKIYQEGLAAANEQNLIVDGVELDPRLEEIHLIDRNSGETLTTTSKAEALKFLDRHRSGFVADGTHQGGNIVIYGTATSAGSRLRVPNNLRKYSAMNDYRLARRSFNSELTAVENVVQTLAHETGHFLGLTHEGVGIYNREFFAVKRYRGM